MMHVSKSRNLPRKVSCKGFVLCGIVSLLLTSAALAKPVTYTGFTISDGKIGSWSFHNARVYLTLQSDTNSVQLFQPLIDPTDPSLGTVDTYVNFAGTASVTVISGTRVVHATFLPNQIFVSMDLGDTNNAPHTGARGAGFGSFTATGIEPTYPLGLEDGTLDWGDIVDSGGTASAQLQALQLDLMNNSALSGRAWPCQAFLNARNNSSACDPPPPLHTDRGDFYLYLPYQGIDPSGPYWGDSLTAGYFLTTLGSGSSPVPLLQPTPLNNASRPITYRGYEIADVTLGEHHYRGAQVYISVDADAAAAAPFSNGPSYGFMNSRGNAHITVVSGARIVSADFDPGQIYVYFDVGNASAGFGSWAGRTGYPLTITQNPDTDGILENSSIEAVADIMRTPGDVQFYTPQTATLVTDLTNATTLSGAASSCVAFDPTTSVCANLAPIPLKTNHGDLYLFEPYTADHGSGPYSAGWGVFWSERAPRRD